MSGGPSREPNILLYTNRLRELNERLIGLTDKVKATADVYGGGVPEPGSTRDGSVNKVEQKGLIQSLEYQIDTATQRFVALESQFHRLSESL